MALRFFTVPIQSSAVAAGWPEQSRTVSLGWPGLDQRVTGHQVVRCYWTGGYAPRLRRDLVLASGGGVLSVTSRLRIRSIASSGAG